MQDHALVRSLQTRRTATLAAVYDLYAKPLYGYCRLLLCDRTEAEGALRDTFLVAELRIDELGDPGKLKPWLFAIARGEAARRRTAGGVQGQRVHQEARSPATATGSTASRSMAEAAVVVLDAAEREALELAERYGLSEPDVAVVLDLSLRRAHALLARAHHRLREALTAVILARTGREECRRLAALTEVDGPLDVARCRRVRRHARMCRKCGRRGSHRASPAKVLTLLTPVELPAGLRWQVLSSYADPALIGYRLHVARRVGALDPTGFPLPAGRRRRVGRQRAATAVTCLLVIVAAVLATPWSRPSERPSDLSVLLPGEPVRPTASHLQSPPVVGRSAHRLSPRPSPSPVPLGARPAAAEDPVLARSLPTAPIAAAVGAVQEWSRGSGFLPALPIGDGHPDESGGSRDDPSSGSSNGWTAKPSGSTGGEPTRSRNGSSTREPSSEPGRTRDESRTATPTPSSADSRS